MHEVMYYREQAARARRLANKVHQRELNEMLLRMARDYDDIAEDLDRGAIEIRHAELMPQTRR